MNVFYDSLILDVDGVLLDSNRPKAENIRESASQYCDPQKLDDFVQFFTHFNGVPRERKIEKYFGENTDTTARILSEYNRLNQLRLYDVSLTPGVDSFLNRWSRATPLLALSGGSQDEVRNLLEAKGIAGYFHQILGGPVTKSAHLKNINLQGGVLYVGDSIHDAEVAEQFGFDFVFMYGYSQFLEWEDYFRERPAVSLISDLTCWPANLQPSKRKTC